MKQQQQQQLPSGKPLRRSSRHRSSSDGVGSLDHHQHAAATAAAAASCIEEDLPILPPPSPGTPPKKTWERQYRSFLARRRLIKQPPAPPSVPTISRNTTTSTAHTSSSNSNNNNNNNTTTDGSVRGGKFFANVFRSSNSSHPDKPKPRQHQRRVKSCSDELDGTLRRGIEKAYSPKNERYILPRSADNAAASSSSALYYGSISSSFIPPPPRLDGTATAATTASSSSTTAATIASSSLFPRVASLPTQYHPQQQQQLHRDAPMTPTKSKSTATASGAAVRVPTDLTGSPLIMNNPIILDNDDDAAADDDDAIRTHYRVEQQKSSSAMKKAFTEFHNSSTTGRDAVSAFLGDEPSHTGATATTLAWRRQGHANNTRIANSGSKSSSNNNGNIASSSSSSSNISRLANEQQQQHRQQQEQRILRPMVGVESWQRNRRYLIGPAALVACPAVVQTHVLSSSSLTTFASLKLGKCWLANQGDLQWSVAVLVLFGNYLLEYDCSNCNDNDGHDDDDNDDDNCNADATVTMGKPPRGYMHLQFATCRPHALDPTRRTLELQVYGSPCAKTDRRTILIRLGSDGNRQQQQQQLEKQAQRLDAFRKALNRAATLRLEDLYEYDTKQELGSGSYSIVCPARRRTTTNAAVGADSSSNSSSKRDNDIDYTHALKIFDKDKFWRHVVNGRERADTIVREASVQTTLTVSCRHVASFLRISGFFETSEQVVLELELLNGNDLFNCISSRSDALEERDAAHVVRDILVSLDAMNRIGVAHRDIKPANILMCSPSSATSERLAVKVGDFGMATFVGVDGHVRGRCGTPGYVAPEIFSAGVYGGYGNKVDIFSAGVTLYVMLCGYEPFYGETDAELVEANKVAHVEYPQDEWSTVSDLAKDMVKKMMHPDPKKRLDAKQALQHPWISQHCKDIIRNGETVVSGKASKEDATAEEGCVIS